MNNHSHDILLTQINEPPQAMRTDIDRDAIFELAHDIKKNGLINPITVRPVHHDDGSEVCFPSNGQGQCGNMTHVRYEIVAGHRRYLAHRYGGMDSIRCIVRELSDDEAFAIMTSENLARENVNPVDEAIHTKRAVDHYRGDLQRVAKMMGRSTAWVVDRMEIAGMQADVQDALREGKIKIGCALALVKITDPLDQTACLQLAIAQGASVVVVNYWVAQWEAGIFGHANAVTMPDSNMPEREHQVVMLRCAIDGEEHPAMEMISMLVARKNAGYLQALREHLKNKEAEDDGLDAEREALDVVDASESEPRPPDGARIEY